MALDNYYHNKIEAMQLEILKGQAVLRRLEAQRNDYNSRVRLLREELGLLQQPGSYVGEVVKVMSTKKVLVKVHPEGKYGMGCLLSSHSMIATGGSGANMGGTHQLQSSTSQTQLISPSLRSASASLSSQTHTSSRRSSRHQSIHSSPS